ncbi:unnamed protein product, partial [Ilex paraguariensis]
MFEQSADHSYTSIDQKLARLSPIPPDCNLFRVYDHLRRINVKAYEPEIIVIGPYHHGKPNLQAMKEHKLRYLQEFLTQAQESSVERYYMATRDLKDRARKCYLEPISLSDNEFVEMMLFDGCFLLEFIVKYNFHNLVNEGDPLTMNQRTSLVNPDVSPWMTIKDVNHILGLAHDCLCLSIAQMVSHRNVGVDDEEWEFINCTTELQEARIQLKEAKG